MPKSAAAPRQPAKIGLRLRARWFLSGMAMLLDFGATRRRPPRRVRIGDEWDDLRAIAGDWQVVGDDMRRAGAAK